MKRHIILALAGAIAVLSGCNGIGRKNQVTIQVAEGTMELLPMTDNSIRVKVYGPETLILDELYYTEKVKRPSYKVKEDSEKISVIQKGLTTVFDRKTQKLSFYDAEGKLLVSEAGRSVEATEIEGKPMASVVQVFRHVDNDHLFGLGQFQDGYLDVMGLTRRLTQVNTQISIPVVISNKGYGLMWNNYGLAEFNPSTETVALQAVDAAGEGVVVNTTSTHGNIRERRMFDCFAAEIEVPEEGDYSLLLDVGRSMARKHYLAVDGEVLFDVNNLWLPPTSSAMIHLTAGTHQVEVRGARGDAPTIGWRKTNGATELRSPLAQSLDYTVFAGKADEVVSAFRTLTGKAPQIPEWALGYVHCRERYTSQDDVLENARTFREKNIPLDVIVQDWQWWGSTGWNSMQFDPVYYSDPQMMVDSLHSMDIKLMLSVWSKIDISSELGKQVDSLGYYIPGTDWIDFFNPDAAAFYWKNFDERLVSLGVDSWWLDATEPENDDLVGRHVGKEQLPGALYRNVYPLKVVHNAYNGLRRSRPDEQPLILTRSAAAGMQRYGAVTWSGDVGNDWETLRRQIVGGLGMMCAGQPWWTYDAGGFFRPADQYDDADYQQRMLRWIQASVMLPIMRVHGYISKTEPWRYSAETEELFVSAINRRYELLPYIRKCAAKVAEEDYTLMRPLVFDFPDDEEAMKQDIEYMFGPDYLVCPIIRADVETARVYLPVNEGGWEYTLNNEHYDGGQYVEVAVMSDSIPIFVRN